MKRKDGLFNPKAVTSLWKEAITKYKQNLNTQILTQFIAEKMQQMKTDFDDKDFGEFAEQVSQNENNKLEVAIDKVIKRQWKESCSFEHLQFDEDPKGNDFLEENEQSYFHFSNKKGLIVAGPNYDSAALKPYLDKYGYDADLLSQDDEESCVDALVQLSVATRTFVYYAVEISNKPLFQNIINTIQNSDSLGVIMLEGKTDSVREYLSYENNILYICAENDQKSFLPAKLAQLIESGEGHLKQFLTCLEYSPPCNIELIGNEQLDYNFLS